MEQLRRIAKGDEAFVCDPERVAQLGDEPVLVGEVGVRWRDGLKLDEPPKLLDLIEMDADALPEQQMAALGDDSSYADRGGERHAQRHAVADLDDSVAALSLLWFARALELDQVRTAGLLLAELESAVGDLEIGIALRDRAAVLGPERPAYLKRCGRVRVGRLQLDVSARRLHDSR